MHLMPVILLTVMERLNIKQNASDSPISSFPSFSLSDIDLSIAGKMSVHSVLSNSMDEVALSTKPIEP